MNLPYLMRFKNYNMEFYDDLKFRAFDIKKKEWLLGYKYESLGGFSLFGECMLGGEWNSLFSAYLFGKNGKEFKDLKVTQFTGFKDDNKKDIYEGDKLKGVSDIPFFVVIKHNGAYKLEIEIDGVKAIWGTLEHFIQNKDRIYFNSELNKKNKVLVVGNVFE